MDSEASDLDSVKRTEMNTSATKLLVAYSDSSDADTDNEDEIQIIDDRRSVHSFDSESDSESSSSSSSESDVSDAILLPEDNCLEENEPKESNCKKGSFHQLKTKSEIGLEDLPPIEDLKITVPKAEVQHVGHVLTIVDCLVTIQTLVNLPALNLDTMLFFENGDSFGQVFDVFGPVSRPLYIVRFNSNSDILDKKISVKMPVYFAPKKEEYTTFVFTETLRRNKGCDASWKDDEEPPNDKLEYSDDEVERSTKNKGKGKKFQKNKEQDSPASNEQTNNWNTKNITRNQGSNWNHVGPHQGGNYNQPPPSQLFAANVPPFLNQHIGMPRFPPYNQQQYRGPYPNQSSFHPVLLPPPPPPPPFFTTFRMPVSSGINPSAFQSHPMASSPAAFVNESSESSGAILPNPFRELRIGETSPVLNSAVPMFPPPGFKQQP